MRSFAVCLTLCALSLLVPSFASADPVTVVATGDSLTPIYRPYLSGALNARGISATTQFVGGGGLSGPGYVAGGYAQQVVDANPRFVTFMLGINDAWYDGTGSFASTAFANYKAAVASVFDQWQSAPGQPTVIVGSILPFDLAKNEAYWHDDYMAGANDRIRDWYNPWLQEQAAAHGFVYLDTWTALQAQPNWTNTLVGEDGLHLTPAGGQWLAGEFAGAISAVPEPNSIAALFAGLGCTAVLRRFRRR